MTERYRPALQKPAPKKALIERFRTTKSNREAERLAFEIMNDKPPPFEFVPLEHRVLLHPPIRHRGEAPGAGLSVFEFRVGTVAIVLAFMSRTDERHQAALRAGKRAMTAKRSSEQPVSNKAENSPREQFEWEGSAGFIMGRTKFINDQADEDWSFETSIAKLLRCAGLPKKGGASRRLFSALDRLTKRVRKSPPLLERWGWAHGKLMLTVHNEWLPRAGHTKGFIRIPLPLPTSGAVVLALHLFLFEVDPRPSGKTSIKAKALYERLGIKTDRPAHGERMLRAALVQVNKHRQKLELPMFELSRDGRGGWRFNAVPKRKSKRERDVERAQHGKAPERSGEDRAIRDGTDDVPIAAAEFHQWARERYEGDYDDGGRDEIETMPTNPRRRYSDPDDRPDDEIADGQWDVLP